MEPPKKLFQTPFLGLSIPFIDNPIGFVAVFSTAWRPFVG